MSRTKAVNGCFIRKVTTPQHQSQAFIHVAKWIAFHFGISQLWQRNSQSIHYNVLYYIFRNIILTCIIKSKAVLISDSLDSLSDVWRCACRLTGRWVYRLLSLDHISVMLSAAGCGLFHPHLSCLTYILQSHISAPWNCKGHPLYMFYIYIEHHVQCFQITFWNYFVSFIVPSF